MIARIWKGRTHKKHYDVYADFLRNTAAPDYQSIAGNLGVNFLRKLENNEAHFTLITFWDSYQSIKQFAGIDYEKAKYYAEDKNYLLEFPEKVEHYEVFQTKSLNAYE